MSTLTRTIVHGALLLTLIVLSAGPAHAATTINGGTPAAQTTTINGGTPATPKPATPTLNSGVSVGEGTTIANPLKDIKSLPDLLKAVFKAVLQLMEFIIVLAFVWIGFLFVRAQGAPGEITKAKKALGWTIVGALILLSAEAILGVVQSTATSLIN